MSLSLFVPLRPQQRRGGSGCVAELGDVNGVPVGADTVLDLQDTNSLADLARVQLEQAPGLFANGRPGHDALGCHAGDHVQHLVGYGRGFLHGR